MNRIHKQYVVIGDQPVSATTRLEWSGNNCVYRGSHAELNAAEADVLWNIFKYDYDSSDNCTMIRFAIGAWSNRTGLWS